jgi:hypothetical protein
MSTTDAHYAEYLAAVAAMPEHTISPRRCLDGHGIGDHITFRLADWGPRTFDDGRIVDINEDRNRLLVETADDVFEVDPRPWPVGNKLPV